MPEQTQNTDSDLQQRLAMEGLQMSSEATSAGLLLMNAKLDMLADHIGIDISDPPLSKLDEVNRDMLLKSVAQRMVRLMQIAAEASGQPTPSPDEAIEAINDIANGVFGEPDKSNDPMPVEEPQDYLEPETGGEEQPDILEPDTCSEEQPEFRTTRNKGFPIGDIFTVSIMTNQDFDGTDFSEENQRNEALLRIVHHYSQAAKEAADAGWIPYVWAERLQQEFQGVMTDTEVESELVLPDPGEVSQGVAETATKDDGHIIDIKGLTEVSEVVEALMTAFMVSTARAHMAISEAMLHKRLAHMGMGGAFEDQG